MAPKYIRGLIFGIVAYIITCHANSLFYLRSFWLDEWIIVSNIKYPIVGLTDLFSDMYARAGMDIPRFHLLLLRILGELGNFSNFSIRIEPFLLSSLSLMLLAVISVRSFGYTFWTILFLTCIASNRYMLHNFTQAKHYPMEIFGAVICLFHFVKYAQLRNENQALSRKFMIGSIFAFALGPLLSLSYGIVAAPLLLTMAYDFFTRTNYRKSLSVLFATFLLSAGFIFFKHYIIFIGTKNIVATGYINEKFDPNRLLHSLKNFLNFFALGSLYPDEGPSEYKNFLISLLRLFASIVALFGLYRVISGFRLRHLSVLKVEHYIFLLFCIIFPLYFTRTLPMAYDRSTYFLLPTVAY